MMQATSSNNWQSWAQSHPQEAKAVTTPRLNRYIPIAPTIKQTLLLLLNHIPEILFGGAAGGSKSYGLLAAALQYVDCPNYHALLLRRTFSDLAQAGALIDISKQWLMGTDATWNERDKRWVFPTGASLSFGYLEHDNDKYRYQGAAYQFIGFDELTQFTESQYTYLFSRLRRAQGINIPLRMRSASNPGGGGHAWVKSRFIMPSEELKQMKRLFIPSRLEDNPYLDREEYRRTSLSNLDDVTRARLEQGDWDVQDSGGVFTLNPHNLSPYIVIAYQDGYYYVAGLDWGQDNDYTALSIMRVKVGENVQEVYLNRWRRQSWASIRAEIIEKLKEYHVEKLLPERNSIGSVNIEDLVDELDKAKMQTAIQAFYTDQRSKDGLVKAMQNGLSEYGLCLLNIDYANYEIKSYETKQSPNGLYSYGAPSGGHDDCVMTRMLAYYGASQLWI